MKILHRPVFTNISSLNQSRPHTSGKGVVIKSHLGFGLYGLGRGSNFALLLIMIVGYLILLIGCTPPDQPTSANGGNPTMTPLSDNGDVIVTPGGPSGTTSPRNGQSSLLLWTDPSVAELTIGESKVIQIRADNPAEINDVELRLEFDPKYIQVVDSDPNAPGVQIQKGDSPVAVQVHRNEVSNESGVIVYHVTREAESQGDESGILATFTVRALTQGGSPLRFGFVTLRDEAGAPLPTPEWVSGLVVISPDGVADESTTQAIPSGHKSIFPRILSSYHATVSLNPSSTGVLGL